MFISKSESFYDAMKPLIYLNCYVGMGALRHPNQSKAKYCFMKFYTAVITLINWSAIYITLNSINQVVNFDNFSPMALMMYKTIICVNSCITVVAPLLVWLRQKGLQDCLRQMLILDDTFQIVYEAPDEYRKRYIHLIYQVVAIIFVMILVVICDIPWIMVGKLSLLKNLAVFITLHRSIIVMLVLDVNFCFFAGYLGKKFRDLNKSLLGLAEINPTADTGARLFILSRKGVRSISGNRVTNSTTGGLINDKHHLLGKIRKAHLELCKLSRQINVAFGIQNLLSMGVSFVLTTGLLYTIYSAFEWKDFSYEKLIEVVPTAIWTAIYIFKIFIVNHSCSNVSNEAQKSGELIYDLLGSKVDKELPKQIQEFGVQMLQNPVRFNACGFFTLDHTSIQGVIGSITTYLVILIQMGHVYEEPNANTFLASNGTGN